MLLVNTIRGSDFQYILAMITQTVVLQLCVLTSGELFLRTHTCICEIFYIAEKSRLFMSVTWETPPQQDQWVLLTVSPLQWQWKQHGIPVVLEAVAGHQILFCQLPLKMLSYQQNFYSIYLRESTIPSSSIKLKSRGESSGSSQPPLLGVCSLMRTSQFSFVFLLPYTCFTFLRCST